MSQTKAKERVVRCQHIRVLNEINEYTQQKQAAIANEEYELAIQCRDNIKNAHQKLLSPSTIHSYCSIQPEKDKLLGTLMGKILARGDTAP